MNGTGVLFLGRAPDRADQLLLFFPCIGKRVEAGLPDTDRFWGWLPLDGSHCQEDAGRAPGERPDRQGQDSREANVCRGVHICGGVVPDDAWG